MRAIERASGADDSAVAAARGFAASVAASLDAKMGAGLLGAYLLGSDLFIKRCDADPARPYADIGCSYETFTRDDMLELETLGPLTRLATGAFLEHIERWTLHRDVHVEAFTDAELDRVLLDKL